MSLDLTKIGQMFKEARESKGLTLEDVSAALYLRKSIVDAMENGSWEKLPHEIYVKGYLNQYASYIGIERELAEATQSCNGAEERAEEQVVKASLQASKGVAPYKSRVVEVLRAIYPGTRYVVYGAGVAVLVAFLAYQNINKSYAPPAPAGNYSVSNTAYESSNAKSPERPIAALNEPKKLVIACQERTWVRIVIDGTEKKELMLNPQEMVAFNAKEGFDLLIGNAGGVTLVYNGNDIGFEGEDGEVKRVRLP